MTLECRAFTTTAGFLAAGVLAFGAGMRLTLFVAAP